MDPAYNAWADAVLIECLRDFPRNAKIDAVLAHMVAAGETWLARMDGGVPPTELWPTRPFEESCAGLTELDRRLAEPRDPSLRREYRNSAGAEFSNTVGEMMAQALNHGTHHRGEIAGLLFAEDREPPIMDYIAYLRERFAEGV